MFITNSRVCINRVRFSILLMVSSTWLLMSFSLSLFAPVNLVSRDRFGRPVPCQPAYPPHSDWIYQAINLVLTHLAVSSGRKGKEIFLSAVQKEKFWVFMSVTWRRHDVAALVVGWNFLKSKYLPTSFWSERPWKCSAGSALTPPEFGTPPWPKTVRVDLRSLETVYCQRIVSKSGTRLSWPISVAREVKCQGVFMCTPLWRGTIAVYRFMASAQNKPVMVQKYLEEASSPKEETWTKKERRRWWRNKT